MEGLIVIFSLFVALVAGYLLGIKEKQERKWLDGYREGLKDAGFDMTAIIEKYSKK